MCNCKDRIILKKGDSTFIAEESFCGVHGYSNSCYLCSVDFVATTETCIACSNRLNRLNKLNVWIDRAYVVEEGYV